MGRGGVSRVRSLYRRFLATIENADSYTQAFVAVQAVVRAGLDKAVFDDGTDFAPELVKLVAVHVARNPDAKLEALIEHAKRIHKAIVDAEQVLKDLLDTRP